MESSKLKRHQLVHTGEKPFQVSGLLQDASLWHATSDGCLNNLSCPFMLLSRERLPLGGVVIHIGLDRNCCTAQQGCSNILKREKWSLHLQSNILHFLHSVHLKAAARDFHWILTFAPTFASILVTDHTSALSIPVTKGLRSQRTSNRTSWRMRKEGSRMLFSRTLTYCVQIFKDGTFLSSLTCRNQVAWVP